MGQVPGVVSGSVQSIVYLTVTSPGVFSLGPPEAHARGPPRLPLPNRRPKEHQASGREDQQRHEERRGSREECQNSTRDRVPH